MPDLAVHLEALDRVLSKHQDRRVDPFLRTGLHISHQIAIGVAVTCIECKCRSRGKGRRKRQYRPDFPARGCILPDVAKCPSERDTSGEVTSCEMSRHNFPQCRRLGAAKRHRMATARVEIATRWWRGRTGNFPAENPVSGAHPWVGGWHCPHQRRRVRMLGRPENRIGGCQFHQLPDIHHRNPVRDMPHHR